MKLIPLTKGYHAMVDDEDFKKVSQFKWYAAVTPHTVYAKRIGPRDINGKRQNILMHRFILGLNPSRIEKQCDHINGNGIDNRKENLRLATGSQNCANTRSPGGKSQYKGVYPLGGYWAAQITMNGKITYLGRYDTETEAALIYDHKARELFGEFARTNF